MELNKWEKEFKEQLSSREIKPSDKAWEKLEAMLSASEKPKNKFPWMYVAASLVGFLLIGTVYFSQRDDTVEIEKNKVVIQKKIDTKEKEKSFDILNTDANQINKKAVVIVPKKSVSTFGKTELSKESTAITDSSRQNQVVVSINNQIEQSESIQSQSAAVTVDELLSRASRTIRVNNKTNPNLTIHVNANNLLLQTDGELEPAFRQNVFSKIVEDLRSVKIVLNSNAE